MSNNPEGMFLSFTLDTRTGKNTPTLNYQAAPAFTHVDDLLEAFDQASVDPTSIPYGTAMRQAHGAPALPQRPVHEPKENFIFMDIHHASAGTRDTSGAEAELYDTCITLMACEVKRLGIERNIPLPHIDELARMTLKSATFKRAYEIARMPAMDTKAASRSFGNGSTYKPIAALTATEQNVLRHAHEHVFAEILDYLHSQKQ